MQKYKYKSLLDILQQIRNLAYQDISYMKSILDPNLNPEQLFSVLKANTTFVNDPPNTELIQRPKTLFENNFHGIPGAGDCDCFTTTVIASCLALNYPEKKIKIVLAGRHKKEAVHIYNNVYNKPFDLCQPFYDMKRNYAFYQVLGLNEF
jgi:hypothetical protein